MSTDVVGYLVQVLSGRPLDDYVAEYITRPLGMNDSGFMVPADRAGRMAACYECDAGVPGAPAYRLTDDPATSRYLGPPAMLSGGGGMVATIDDYRRFADMLLGKGELDGVRVLGRKHRRVHDLQPPARRPRPRRHGPADVQRDPFAGVGFGLGFSVALDPVAANVIDSPGQFAWGGLAGTYFWVDPVEELSVVFFAQLIHSNAVPTSPPRVLRRRLKPLIYQALVD